MTPIVSEEHREERKKIILNAAKEVFIKNGYNGTAMQDIIQHSGISRGGVYTYFDNIEDIFLELLKKRDIEDSFDLQALYKDYQSNWNVLLNILASIKNSIEQNLDRLVPAIYEYYFTTGFKSKKHISSLEKRISEAVNVLTKIIVRGIEEEEFNKNIEAEDIARMILSFCDGIYMNAIHLSAKKINITNQFKAFEICLKITLLKDQ